MYQWDWHIIYAYKIVFLEGALYTIGLTLFAILIGTIAGFLLALLQRAKSKILSVAVRIYVELFRALPVLVLLIWIFYVGPIVFGWRLSAFTSALIALSLNLSAFVVETVRAGIESVPQGQYESGVALGMTDLQIMRNIVFPQMIKGITPNMISLYTHQLKNSSLASIIGVNELLHRSNTLISNTFRPLEIYTAVALMYLALIFPFSLLASRFERKLKLRVRQL